MNNTKKDRVFIFDTTLRDGGQTSSVSFSIDDKIKMVNKLNELGVDYIEAGWPNANDIDTKIFEYCDGRKFGSKITAFGMTSKLPEKTKDTLNDLVKSNAKIITIVGKTWDFHVTEALKIGLEDNLNAIKSSVEYLKSQNIEVLFDAEHFFDGFKENEDYAIRCIDMAYKSGADWVVLCDTNGGTLTFEIEEIIKKVKEKLPNVKLGIHVHNDTGSAVANSLIAVKCGVRMVQGTINGLGERCGNADLCSIIPTLELKMGYDCGAVGKNLTKIKEISEYLNLVLNKDSNNYAPYIGKFAFAHKGGLHASAMERNKKTYEHIEPHLVGNERFILVSNQAGRSNIRTVLDKLNIDLPESEVINLTNLVKEKENDGYSFEGADASFELFVLRKINKLPKMFDIDSYKVLIERRHNAEGKIVTISEAIVRATIDGDDSFVVSNGEGPVDSLDKAIRLALQKNLPEINKIKLLDYKVRIVSGGKIGTKSLIKVSIEFGDIDEKRTWNTVGVSQNIIDASFIAIRDGIVWGLK